MVTGQLEKKKALALLIHIHESAYGCCKNSFLFDDISYFLYLLPYIFSHGARTWSLDE